MMWSGHTWNTLIGAYFLSCGLRRLYPRFWTRKLWTWSLCGSCASVGCPLNTPQGLFVFLLTLLESILLMVDWSHYTIDIFVAWILGLFVLSNDRFMFWLYYLNPFAAGQVAFEDNLYYQRLRMRKLIYLRREEAKASESIMMGSEPTAILLSPTIASERADMIDPSMQDPSERGISSTAPVIGKPGEEEVNLIILSEEEGPPGGLGGTASSIRKEQLTPIVHKQASSVSQGPGGPVETKFFLNSSSSSSCGHNTTSNTKAASRSWSKASRTVGKTFNGETVVFNPWNSRDRWILRVYQEEVDRSRKARNNI